MKNPTRILPNVPEIADRFELKSNTNKLSKWQLFCVGFCATFAGSLKYVFNKNRNNKYKKAIYEKPPSTDFEAYDRVLKGACLGFYILLGFVLFLLILQIVFLYIPFPKPILLPIINSYPPIYCKIKTESNYQDENGCNIDRNCKCFSYFCKDIFSNREYSKSCTYHNSIKSNQSRQYNLFNLISLFFNPNNFYNCFIHKEEYLCLQIP